MTSTPDPAAVRGPHAPAPAPPTKILIVDDSPVDRRIAAGIVEKRPGTQVLTAADGGEALEVIAREAPAAVVTDLQMPGIDGLELVEQIRRLHPQTPVILMTAYGSEEIAIEALKAGAASYVPKRSLARDLVATLDRVAAVGAIDQRRRRIMGCMEGRQSSFRLENDAALIDPLIVLLQEDLAGIDFCDETGRIRVGIALQEALANALYHGNLEVPRDLRQDDERGYHQLALRRLEADPYRGRRIGVRASFDRARASYVIDDEGPGFDTTALDRPIDPADLTRIGGRGLLLMRTFMDEVSFNDAGNQVTLIKRHHLAAAEPVAP